jgi:hypothetical protein
MKLKAIFGVGSALSGFLAAFFWGWSAYDPWMLKLKPITRLVPYTVKTAQLNMIAAALTALTVFLQTMTQFMPD